MPERVIGKTQEVTKERNNSRQRGYGGNKEEEGGWKRKRRACRYDSRVESRTEVMYDGRRVSAKDEGEQHHHEQRRPRCSELIPLEDDLEIVLIFASSHAFFLALGVSEASGD